MQDECDRMLAEGVDERVAAAHLVGCERCRLRLDREHADLIGALRSPRADDPSGAGTLVDRLRRSPPAEPVAAHAAAFGPYRVVRTLGVGGMGTVFAAEDPTLRREVAIKVLAPRWADQPAARERFLREARSAAALGHDGIVPILHIGEERGAVYLVMPLLHGESLEQRLRAGPPLTEREVRAFAAQVADALAYAHARGIVHRDVKPANLWLARRDGPDGEPAFRVKILDFGLSLVADDAELTSTGTLLGTPGYLAPEQADGGDVDGRADVFSLGCVLYRLTTGVPAFPGATPLARLAALSRGAPPPVLDLAPSLSPAFADLVGRMLDPQRVRRPSAADLRAELAQLPPPAPVRIGPLRRMARRIRRVGWRPAAIALSVALNLALAAWLLVPRGGTGGDVDPTRNPHGIDNRPVDDPAIARALRAQGIAPKRIARAERLVCVLDEGNAVWRWDGDAFAKVTSADAGDGNVFFLSANPDFLADGMKRRGIFRFTREGPIDLCSDACVGPHQIAAAEGTAWAMIAPKAVGRWNAEYERWVHQDVPAFEAADGSWYFFGNSKEVMGKTTYYRGLYRFGPTGEFGLHSPAFVGRNVLDFWASFPDQTYVKWNATQRDWSKPRKCHAAPSGFRFLFDETRSRWAGPWVYSFSPQGEFEDNRGEIFRQHLIGELDGITWRLGEVDATRFTALHWNPMHPDSGRWENSYANGPHNGAKGRDGNSFFVERRLYFAPGVPQEHLLRQDLPICRFAPDGKLTRTNLRGVLVFEKGDTVWAKRSDDTHFTWDEKTATFVAAP